MSAWRSGATTPPVGASSGAKTPKSNSKLVKNARINVGGKAGIIHEKNLDSEVVGLGEA